MTTLSELASVLGKLALQLRVNDVDEATAMAYWEALQDLPLEAIRAAQETLAREPGRRWLPTTGEWREQALVARRGHVERALPPGRSEPWRDECGECRDTGWVMGLTCDGGGRCGRTKPHRAHDYTCPCACRQTNRTYQRHYASR